MRPDALAQEIAQLLAPLMPSPADGSPALDAAAVAALLAPPPKPDMGDMAFPCFTLARSLRTAPPKIAAELATKFAAKVEADGPL
ncbi:MAG: hypothetical protein KC457_25135, partial [Myxococcales bacterium]|nr:hypothetical protein [Myxococcales bacterium]